MPSARRGRSARICRQRELSLDEMTQQAVAEFRLEPGRLWWHDRTLVGNFDQIVHTDRDHRERDGRAAGFDEALQLRRPACASNEIDALIRANIANLEQRPED